MDAPAKQSRLGLTTTFAAALVYCIWLGAHWLPMGMSDKELAASASRVWDVKREIVEQHSLPWWTPNYMSGSSYGLNHARGFYLVPWMLLSTFTDLITAGKLTALAAIFFSAMAMYFCARYFLKNEWAAVLAALAFMLHPEQIIRAAGAEHITISLFFPFIPLLWLTLARALESNSVRDTFLCALVAVLAWWTDNKQAFIHFLFLFAYALYWLWPRRKQWQPTARTCGLLAGMGLALGAWVITPGVVESKYVKLFVGDPLAGWQKAYSFKSLLGLVDRNGAVTRDTIQAVTARLQANEGRVNSQAELEHVQRVLSLNADSPEKYMGLALLAVIAVTMLWNDRRVDRRAFWFFVASLLASVMLATGLNSVWTANWQTWQALSSQGHSVIANLGLLLCTAFLVVFYRRKLTTSRKKVVVGITLAVFLFVPGFGLLAALPYFGDIRAPFVFYDGPGAFWGAMLIGFFVTDVSVERASRPFVVVGVVAALLLLDYWPYQKPMKDNGVSAQTLQNLQAAYSALQPDKDWVKTYSVTGRYFHLLGPMWGGKPQVYEAFYNWMSPLGTGLLNQQAFSSWENHRAFLNLLAARYVVFDKSDPNNTQQGTQQILSAYRQSFSVEVENEDIVVFRNNSARPYLSAYARACLFDGELQNSPRLALTLEERDWPLVHGSIRADTAGKYEVAYRDGNAPPPLRDGQKVSLTNVQLVRETAQRIRIRLTAPQNCLAVIAESYYPFWRAEVDGKPAEVQRVSCAFMGLELPAGEHEIVLRYETPGAYAAAGVVSLLGFLTGLVATIRSSRARRRAK